LVRPQGCVPSKALLAGARAARAPGGLAALAGADRAGARRMAPTAVDGAEEEDGAAAAAGAGADVTGPPREGMAAVDGTGPPREGMAGIKAHVEGAVRHVKAGESAEARALCVRCPP